MSGASVYQMISGLGDAFGDAYANARKQAQEDEAPALISGLLAAQGGVASPAAANPVAASEADTGPKLPTFAGLSGANPSADRKINGTNADFVSAMMPHALEASKATGVDPRIILAQSAIETGWGKSAPGNNYFGIKSHGAAGGNTMATTEVVNGQPVRINDSFRAFPDMAASAAGYGDFINKNPRYAGLKQAQGLDAQAAALQRSGYATDPNYGAKVLSVARRLPDPGIVTSAQPDAANLPTQGAQPAGFQIPGQDAAAPAAPAGFAGFGSGASRMSPEMRTALNAAWKNPNTRPMAQQMLTSLLQGKDASWSIVDLGNGRKAMFDQKTARTVPIPGTGESFGTETDADGNLLSVNQATGQRTMLKAAADSKFTYQNVDGVGMVALHPTEPDKSRIIIAGKQPRPLTAEERQSFGIPEGTGAGMGPDGKPFGIGGARTQVNVDTKGAGKFAEKANEIQAKRYGEMVDAADNAVPLRADIDTMAALGEQIATGKLAGAKLGLAQYAKAAGLDGIADGLTNGKMGEMEAYTALADKLVPRMRVPGSGSTSDAEGRAFRNSLPSLLKTPDGNRVIVDTFRGLADYQAQAGDLAGKALRGEVSQGEADQAIRALPSPFSRFKAYRSGGTPEGGAPAASATTTAPKSVAKGANRVAIPDGRSAGAAVAEARAAVAGGKDPRVIADMLRSWGIDPARLDQP